MKILKSAVAGTMESSDIMITIEPAVSGISIDLTSTVEQQFGRKIREVIRQTLKTLQVENASVTAVDKGALDCTVRARTEAAVFRALDEEKTDWRLLYEQY